MAFGSEIGQHHYLGSEAVLTYRDGSHYIWTFDSIPGFVHFNVFTVTAVASHTLT